MYAWARYKDVRPYAKFLIDFAGMDFKIPFDPNYTHDTRTAYVPGGGFELAASHGFWVRLDYEYQIWQPMFSTTSRPTPQGFTLGVDWEVAPRRTQ